MPPLEEGEGCRGGGFMPDLRTDYLAQYFDEVTPKEFYRSIFPMGELQEKGVMNDRKYNAIAIEVMPDDSEIQTKRYTITDDLDQIDKLVKHKNFILLSPISYCGKSRESVNARFIYALAIDLDGVNKVQNMADLFHQMDVADFLPRPTYVVSSGNGLHIYYVFKEPIPCFKNITDQMVRLKHNLTKKLWNGYLTDLSENVQYQSLFQGFRLVGGVTKNGDIVRAFETGKKVDLEYLNQYVQSENQVKKFTYKSKLTLEQAKKKYPEWYDKRIVKKLPKGTWKCKRDLYDWWKRKLMTEIVEGHRYYGVMMLSIYAKKCGITREELEQDAFGFISRLDRLTSSEDNHFTRADVLSALEMYNDNYITFPIETISKLTNVRIDRNKRNGLKQKQHLHLARRRKEDMKDIDLPMKAPEGRPKGSSKERKIVMEWQTNHPDGKKADCIRDTGLSKPTVYRWWNGVDNTINKKKWIVLEEPEPIPDEEVFYLEAEEEFDSEKQLKELIDMYGEEEILNKFKAFLESES